MTEDEFLGDLHLAEDSLFEAAIHAPDEPTRRVVLKQYTHVVELLTEFSDGSVIPETDDRTFEERLEDIRTPESEATHLEDEDRMTHD